ncbi:MAG: hypothetical protein ACRDOB_11485, partial [Streptosporangiaceae bacterium]
RGLTMVLVTHDSSIARRAQRIGIMKNGRLTFRQPRPGRAQSGARPAGSQAAGSQAVGSQAVGSQAAGSKPAGSRSGARTATTQAEPATAAADLQPPDMPVYADADLTDRHEPGPADLAEPDLNDLDDSDLDDSGSLDEPDEFADSDSEPADTVRFD